MTDIGTDQVPLTREEGIALAHQMLRIRRFEESCAELYGAGKIRGFLHLYIGEEAVAAGALSVLRPDDAVVATYREHGHALVRGLTAKSIMAEMFGKVTGCCHGHGGSMHLFDAATRFYGGNAIVGGGLPMAVGLGLADRMQHVERVTACFFGDGAVAEGVFHESMNLAALWKLPVLFCCENNGYAMGTSLERSESQTDLCAKAASYRIPARPWMAWTLSRSGRRRQQRLRRFVRGRVRCSWSSRPIASGRTPCSIRISTVRSRKWRSGRGVDRCTPSRGD